MSGANTGAGLPVPLSQNIFEHRGLMKSFDRSRAADTDYLVQFSVDAMAQACDAAVDGAASARTLAVRSQAMTLHFMQRSPKLLPHDEHDDFATALLEGLLPREPISLRDLQALLRGRVEWASPRLDEAPGEVMGHFVEHSVRGSVTTVSDVINLVVGLNGNRRFASPKKWGIDLEAELADQRFGPRWPASVDGDSREPSDPEMPPDETKERLRSSEWLEGRMEDLLAALRARASEMLHPTSADRASVAPHFPAMLLAVSHTLEYRWTTASVSDIDKGQHHDQLWSGMAKEALAVVMPDISDDQRYQYVKRAVDRGYLPAGLQDGGVSHG